MTKKLKLGMGRVDFTGLLAQVLQRHSGQWGSLSLLIKSFLKQALVVTCLQYKSFENTVGKGEIACNKQFLLFPQCFLLAWRTFSHFHQMLLSSANSFSSEDSLVCCLGKG